MYFAGDESPLFRVLTRWKQEDLYLTKYLNKILKVKFQSAHCL